MYFLKSFYIIKNNNLEKRVWKRKKKEKKTFKNMINIYFYTKIKAKKRQKNKRV